MLGLEVNMYKSDVMIVGSGDGCESKIAGFEVKKEIKYLGDKGSMKRTMCEKVIKAKRLRNWVSYLVGGRRRKMEMGRIIWKR